MDKQNWKTNLALELTMQDVLDNLEELSTMVAYQFTPCDFEILANPLPNREHANNSIVSQASH